MSSSLRRSRYLFSCIMCGQKFGSFGWLNRLLGFRFGGSISCCCCFDKFSFTNLINLGSITRHGFGLIIYSRFITNSEKILLSYCYCWLGIADS